MKEFLKKNKRVLIAAAAVLLLGTGWLLLWQHLGNQVSRAALDAAYDQIAFDRAYYAKCDLETVQLYLPDANAIGKALCGAQLGTLSFPAEEGTVSCPVYACKELEEAGKKRAVIFLERGSELLAYELSGFQYLDGEPDIWAVCASYGIGMPEDFESVTVCDQEGQILETIRDAEGLSAFYDKFVKLGEDLGKEGTAKAYYRAYTEKFGDTGRIYLQNGEIEAADDDTYNEAMTYWTEDLRMVTIRLSNGLMLRNCIYAPVPGVFSVYGDYAITESFF